MDAQRQQSISTHDTLDAPAPGQRVFLMPDGRTVTTDPHFDTGHPGVIWHVDEWVPGRVEVCW